MGFEDHWSRNCKHNWRVGDQEAHLRKWQKKNNAIFPAACALFAAVGVLCADTTPAQEVATNQTVDEIVVTGSRIPRPDFTTPSPLTTVDHVEIRLAGTTTIEDMLDSLPQVVPGLNRSANIAPASDRQIGQAAVNLRGLGPQRTLVLLDGRRFVSSNTEGTVDLNNIPSALVDRIELVTGGASAVYGSDAIAGAVNFILKRDFQGVQAQAQYDITDRGDGDVFDISISAGTRFAGGRGYLTGFLAYHDRSSILRADREISAVVLDEDRLTGELSPGGSVRTPEGVIPGNFDIGGVPAQPGITFNSDGSPRPFQYSADYYNFAPLNFLQIPLERWTAAVFADYESSTGVRIYAEALFVDSLVSTQQAPIGNPSRVLMNIDSPFVHPVTRQVFEDYLDPDGDGIAEINFFKRFEELGPRKVDDDSQTLRLVLGVSGPLRENWTWDSHAVYSTSDYDEIGYNGATLSRLRQSLLVDPVTFECFDTSNGCAPANVFGAGNMSPEAADFIRAPALTDVFSVTETLLNASILGDVEVFGGRSLGVAVGVEYREDESDYSPAPEREIGDIMGALPVPAVSSSIRMTEMFGELRLPILSDQTFARELTIEAGYRYTDHNVVSDYDSWKVSGLWSPVSGLSIRGSIQDAVRAPNSQELFASQSIIDVPFIWSNDFCSNEPDRNPVDLGLVDVCLAQGIPADQIDSFQATPFFETTIVAGGNPDLEVESSDTTTVGIVLQPTMWPSVSVSVDYYSISIDNAIQELGANDVVQSCFILNSPNSDLCRSVQRDDPTFNITDVAAGPTNIAKLETEGLDLQITASFDLPSSVPSSLDFRFLGNHTMEYDSQTAPTAPLLECAGFFGFPCVINTFFTLPDYKTQTRLTYNRALLAISLQHTWISGIDNAWGVYSEDVFGIPPESLNLAIPSIDAEHYLTVSFDYEFNNGIGIYGGIHNLTDNDPPVLGGNTGGLNTNPSLYDVYGRRYFAGIVARFGN